MGNFFTIAAWVLGIVIVLYVTRRFWLFLLSLFYIFSDAFLPQWFSNFLLRILPTPRFDIQRVSLDVDKPLPGEPRTAQAYIELGDEWISLGDEKDGKYDQAIACFTKAILLEPDIADAYAQRAAAWQDDQQREFDDYNKAIELGSTSADALRGRGHIYEMRDQMDLARQDYDRAIKLAPNEPWGYSARASLRAEQEDFDGAIEDYSTAIDLDSEWDFWRWERGELYLKSRQYDKAVDDLTVYLDENSDVSSAYASRAEAYRKLGDISKAQEDERLAAKYADDD